MVFAGVIFLVLLIVAVGIAMGVRNARDPGASLSPPGVIARRVYLYGIAFSALGMLVTGLAGLLEVLIGAVLDALGVTPPPVEIGDVRGRVSFFGALALIGLIAWGIHWGLAQRSVRHDDVGERRSGVRKLFLYLGLLVGGVLLTTSLRSLMADLLRWLFGQSSSATLFSGGVLEPLSLLAVVGVFWAYYARIARDDRRVIPEVGDGATLRRWYLYSLSFFGLFLFLFPTTELLQTLWERSTSPATAPPGEPWLATAVSGLASSMAVGLTLWSLAWKRSSDWFARIDDADPERRSILRKVYLYTVLAIVVARTVWNLGGILYGLLRTAMIPDRTGIIADLGSALTTALVFGLAWVYHARVLQREAAFAGEIEEQATVRRIYAYLVALVGAITLAIGGGGTLATILDLVVQPDAGEPFWWQEQLSLYSTLIVVGLPVWLLPWTRLQREATEPSARQAPIRRIYLFVALGTTVLTLLGSGAFTLYLLIRFALGERWTTGQTSELLTAASSAVAAGTFLAYHLRVFRRDAIDAPAVNVGAPLPVVTAATTETLLLVRATTPDLLAEFIRKVSSQVPVGVKVETVDLNTPEAQHILRRIGASR